MSKRPWAWEKQECTNVSLWVLKDAEGKEILVTDSALTEEFREWVIWGVNSPKVTVN